MSSSSIRCIVEGHVQGVFFRAATRDEAAALGLRGGASNLPDGSVEVVASGRPEQLQALTAWLWRGSPSARVTNVSCSEYSGDALDYPGDVIFPPD